MNLTETRQMLATDLSALEYTPGKNIRCTPRPVKGNLRAGDAWVVVDITSPGQFQTEFAQTLICYISLGADEDKAEELADNLTIPVMKVGIAAVAYDIQVRRMQIIAGDPTRPGAVYALALTLTKEITS